MKLISRLLASNLAVFVLALAITAVATRGRPMVAVDTALYVRITDDLLAGDLGSLFTSQATRWTKLTFLSVMVVAKVIAPDHWMFIVLGVNILASAATATLLVDLVRRTTRSAAACAVALLFYLTSFDVLVWVGRMLTDTLYVLLAFIPFYLLCRSFLRDAPRGAGWLLPGSIVAAVFSRPPGIVLVPLVAFAKLVLTPGPANVRRRRATVIVFAALSLATLLWRTWIVEEPNRWPFHFLNVRIAEFAGREKSGEVIYDRREADRTPPSSYGDHLMMQGVRFVRFFQVTSSSFSPLHNLIGLVTFVPLYLLGFLALLRAARGDEPGRRAAVFAALLWIVTFAFFHAITILDFDWRFRTPLLPHFAFLAGCGVDALAGQWRRRKDASES